ncbi:MAG TPA: Mur ligase domain-containing protein, partial [Longimicrobiales bacterium]|nr:Mur ligase domain-containing protein [Longimicrobiales bacterium]
MRIHRPRTRTRTERRSVTRTGRNGAASTSLSSLLSACTPVSRGSAPGADPNVTGVSADSRTIRPGHVFVAIRGTRLDGHAFIDEAVARGAAAVVAERLPDQNPGVPVVVVPDARKALAGFAAAWYGFPGNRIPLVGITGTFGKTSVLAT